MSAGTRIVRLEASRTAVDLVNGWLDQVLTFPSQEAYVARCLAFDPPVSPLSELRLELARIAASHPPAVRASWLRRTTGDLLVLYSLANDLQQEAAQQALLWYNAIAHHGQRLEPLLQLRRGAFDEEQRQHQIAIWVPRARDALAGFEVASRIRHAFEDSYFRGRDVRYPDTKTLDEAIDTERRLLRWRLEQLETAVGADVAQADVDLAALIGEGVRQRFAVAQLEALRILGEDEQARSLLRDLIAAAG